MSQGTDGVNDATTGRFYAQDRPAWRQWLEAHAATSAGIWLVYDKGSRRSVSYDDIVEEALCFGWIDSRPRSLNDRQAMLYVSPRKLKSGWSRVNKERVERLLAEGLVRPAGLATIEAAKANGQWTALDGVEQLTEPEDLRAALDANRTARAQWNAFPRSAKRAILEWIGNAKKPETRAARVVETVSEAAQGRRANQWRQPKETLADASSPSPRAGKA
ncbi:MAG TPA: YdeI/OmpD-associated family protein [Ktedonobacterales bacterium]